MPLGFALLTLVAEVAADPLAPAAGEQDAAQDGMERGRVDVGSRVGGDRLGRGVGVLGRKAALLDRDSRDSGMTDPSHQRGQRGSSRLQASPRRG